MKLFNLFKKSKPRQIEWEPKKVPNGKIISVDIERTQKYYDNNEDKDRCNCEPCLTYYSEIKDRYPHLDKFLSNLGVDISKPFEAVSMGLSTLNKPEEYFVWYVVFGKSDIDYAEKVEDLTVYRQLSHPRTNLEEEHFVLEVFGMKFK